MHDNTLLSFILPSASYFASCCLLGTATATKVFPSFRWIVISLASQLYFSLFPVGGARGREKYVWTLWPAFHAMKECVQWLQVTCMVWKLSSYICVTVLWSLCPHWQAVATESSFRTILLAHIEKRVVSRVNAVCNFTYWKSSHNHGFQRLENSNTAGSWDYQCNPTNH